jgi:hypothetical protein
LENPNHSEKVCPADEESDFESNTGIDDPECPEQQGVNAGPNVPRLGRPTRKLKRQAEKVFMRVNLIETSRHKGVKKK